MKKSIFYGCYHPRDDKDKKAGKELLPFTEQAIKYAKEDGLEGIEILPSNDLSASDGVEYAKVLRDRLDKEGIECSCFSHGLSMLYDPKQALVELKNCVDVAKILGSPFFHHTFQVSFKRDVPKDLSVYPSPIVLLSLVIMCSLGAQALKA